MEEPLESPQAYWRQKARMVALRWNFAAWLNLFLRFALAMSFVMMCALLVLRRAGGSTPVAWWIYSGAMLLGAIACLLLARKRFCSRRDALVRLDSTLKLNNRLTSAADGVGDWPQEASATPDGLRWRWGRVLAPPLASFSALFFAAIVPITPEKANDMHHKEEPLAWTHVEAQLETLKKQDIVNQESILTLEQQVEQLRKQSPEDWYSHSSLEASDNLQAKANEAIRALKRDMESVSNTLDTVQQNGEMMTDADLQKLGAQFQQPLQGLELGTLPLNKELLSKLKDIDPSELRNLSKEQLDKLRDSLKKGIAGCKACLNPGEADDPDAELIGLAEGSGTDKTDASLAAGGIWGGGPAPLGTKPDETNLKTNTNTQIASDDLSHAASGDTLGVSKGQHQVDPSKYSGPASAGAIQSTGAGGEAVWKNDLTPQEREILEKFYK